jgi:hypothetical protein
VAGAGAGAGASQAFIFNSSILDALLPDRGPIHRYAVRGTRYDVYKASDIIAKVGTVPFGLQGRSTKGVVVHGKSMCQEGVVDGNGTVA